MNRYRRILVPYDGSDAARRALDEAIVLASDDGIIRLIHIANEFAQPANRRQRAVPAGHPSSHEPGNGETAVDEHPASGLNTAEWAATEPVRAGQRLLAESVALVLAAGVAAEGHLYANRDERVSALVCADARRWSADLIVMGTHGRSGARRLVLGSEAEAVLHQTAIPVLLVREPKRAAAVAVA